MSDPHGFRVRESHSVFTAGFLEIFEEDVESPSGEGLTRFTVRHPGAVVIVAVDDNGNAVLVRQFRTAVRRALLEAPAGKREPGEDPETTAARELEEEVGVRPGRLVKLAEFYNSPGFTDELTHVFLATELAPGDPAPDLKAEEQHMEIEWIRLDAVDELVRSGELSDAKTLIGLELARRHLAGGYRAPGDA